MSITRLDYSYGCMEENDDGEYVKYSEVEMYLNMASKIIKNKCYIMKFDYDQDSWVQHSVSMSFERGQQILIKLRNNGSEDKYKLFYEVD